MIGYKKKAPYCSFPLEPTQIYSKSTRFVFFDLAHYYQHKTQKRTSRTVEQLKSNIRQRIIQYSACNQFICYQGVLPIPHYHVWVNRTVSQPSTVGAVLILYELMHQPDDAAILGLMLSTLAYVVCHRKYNFILKTKHMRW